jgi:hypothetical protein
VCSHFLVLASVSILEGGTLFEGRYLDLKGKMDHGENCIMKNFITCILH